MVLELKYELKSATKALVYSFLKPKLINSVFKFLGLLIQLNQADPTCL